MNGKLSGYKIPKLAKPVHLPTVCGADWRVNQRSEFTRIYANRCIYCKDFHSPNSYCFQIRLFTMPGHSRKRRHETSDEEEDGVEDGEATDTDSDREDRQQLSDEDSAADDSEEEPEDLLRSFYSKVERIDKKDVTLKLSKRTEKLYFSTVLGRGKFDREGREKIRDKYFLGPRQYSKFNPPDLLNTKLHIVESMDFSGLSQKLQGLHGKLRDVAKVELKHFEALATSEAALKAYTAVDVFDGDIASDEFALVDLQSYMTEPGAVDDSEEVEFSRSSFDKMKLELEAFKRKDSDTMKSYRKVLNKLEEADKVAREGLALQELSYDLVWDQLQLTGQLDVFLRLVFKWNIFVLNDFFQ